MPGSSAGKFKVLESPFVMGDQPILEFQAPLSVFIKSAAGGSIQYTSIYNRTMDQFTGVNLNTPHQHNYFELMYVLSGSLTNYIEDKKVHYHAGDGCLMNRHVSHYEVPDEGCTVIFVALSVSFLTELFQEADPEKSCGGAGPVFQFLRSNISTDNGRVYSRSYIEFTQQQAEASHSFHILLDSLQTELVSSEIGAGLFQQGLVLRIISALQKEELFFLKLLNLDLTKEEFLVNQVLNFIERKHGNLRRSELSEALHYNEEYLNRLVKKHTGCSMMKHAQKIKVDSASRLLLESTLPVREIAEIAGFASESHFYRFFKTNTSSSPDKFRKQR
ncbi:helix-turn-helix transcriptional regulator [Paenibacillus sp. MMS20-IR301]|uniref:AraC family transcriptional regulator n=1 Tax=Paenibacillus sp. MMS20-IR301 TaxID=2895946 RepID=UPI0028E38794|nr:helix-turn-helix transcriptional regulator [Paenibacillus sp. MMS20-IR301]WNS40737.1 helix-turn-helix transcriptional regulator [Paenibacillus sp. MMS20-IR301]